MAVVQAILVSLAILVVVDFHYCQGSPSTEQPSLNDDSTVVQRHKRHAQGMDMQKMMDMAKTFASDFQKDPEKFKQMAQNSGIDISKFMSQAGQGGRR